MNESGLPDLMPDFESRTVAGDGAEIFLRMGGTGPPLLLVHGFPQTHVMWHRIAPELARHFTVVIPDLRGYGQSSVPASDPEHRAYSKRVMARDLVAVMAGLGHERFDLVGHDRGARVGYRLALDHPDRVERLAVLDIVPTHAMWHGFSVDLAMKVYHWLFLAQPEPLPETLIGGSPAFYVDYTMASWTKGHSLDPFDPNAMAHYRAFLSEPARLHATCEDYRAGQTCDLADDEADAATGRRVQCPLLALWGAGGIPGKVEENAAGNTDTPLEIWRRWADDVTGGAIDSGHFVAEENPQATLAALMPFLAR